MELATAWPRMTICHDSLVSRSGSAGLAADAGRVDDELGPLEPGEARDLGVPLVPAGGASPRR